MRGWEINVREWIGNKECSVDGKLIFKNGSEIKEGAVTENNCLRMNGNKELSVDVK